jgi:transposase-like protein
MHYQAAPLSGGMMPARKWTEAEKQRALELYAAEDVHAASQRTGVPVATIRSWAQRTTKAIGRAGQSVTGAEIVVSRSARLWTERRSEAVAEIGELVWLAFGKARECLESGRMRDLKDCAISIGILADKAELLSGRATSRSETFQVHASVEDVEARIAELEAELGYR